jgi:hypothetical protein
MGENGPLLSIERDSVKVIRVGRATAAIAPRRDAACGSGDSLIAPDIALARDKPVLDRPGLPPLRSVVRLYTPVPRDYD